tara:strand:- start:1018 stop:3186 length:2169 start_codon:yes stop_codon:yes gene_type:complete
MASKSGVLNVIVGAKITDFLTKMQVVQNKTKKTAAVSGAAMTAFGRAGVLAMGAAAIASVRMAAQFETSMTKIETLVGISRKEVDKMRESVRDMASDIGKGPQELAEGLFFITSAGLRGSDAMLALESASKASALGLGEVKDIADATTSIVNAYGTSVIDAAQATELLLKTVRLGKVEASSLAPSLGQVIPIAQALGISFEEVGANIATVTRVGLGAEEAITTLKGLLVNFIKVGPQAAEALGSVGLTAEGLRQTLKEEGLLTTLQLLKDRFDGNVDAMGKVIPKARALINFLAVMGQQTDTYNDILLEMETNTDLVGEGMDRLNEDAGHQFELLLGKLSELALSFGDNLLMHVLPAVKALNVVLKDSEDQAKKTKEAIDKIPERFDGKPAGSGGFDKQHPDFGKSFTELGFGEEFDGFKTFGDGANDAFLEVQKLHKETLALFETITKKTTFTPIVTKTAEELEEERVAAKIAAGTTGKVGTAGFGVKGGIGGFMQGGDRSAFKAVELSLETIEKDIDLVVHKSRSFAEVWKTDVVPALEFASQSLGRLTSIHAMSIQNQMAGIDAKQAKEREAMEASGAGREALAELDKKHDKERAKIQSKAAKQNQLLGMANAAVNTAVGVTKALATGGPVLAAIVAAIGATEIGVIASTPIPAFASGGITAGGSVMVGERGAERVDLPAGSRITPNHALGGDGELMATVSGDDFVVWLNRQKRKHRQR